MYSIVTKPNYNIKKARKKIRNNDDNNNINK